jgi:hypothetical protein
MKQVRFDWDAEKDKQNQEKHGVSFELARFVSHIEAVLSALSVQDTGEKGGKYMKSKIKYTDEPLGKLRIVDDFLPPPEDLFFKEENVKITITLSKASVDFFKNEAKNHNTQYQKMIRRLLDVYAAHYKQPPQTNQD